MFPLLSLQPSPSSLARPRSARPEQGELRGRLAGGAEDDPVPGLLPGLGLHLAAPRHADHSRVSPQPPPPPSPHTHTPTTSRLSFPTSRAAHLPSPHLVSRTTGGDVWLAGRRLHVSGLNALPKLAVSSCHQSLRAQPNRVHLPLAIRTAVGNKSNHRPVNKRLSLSPFCVCDCFAALFSTCEGTFLLTFLSTLQLLHHWPFSGFFLLLLLLICCFFCFFHHVLKMCICCCSLLAAWWVKHE